MENLDRSTVPPTALTPPPMMSTISTHRITPIGVGSVFPATGWAAGRLTTGPPAAVAAFPADGVG